MIDGISIAAAGDNAELVALHGRHAMRSGPFAIRYDRSPDFFAILRCRGGTTRVVVERDGDGIRAFGSVTTRRGYLHGAETTVGYLGDLRVVRRPSRWREALAELMRESPMYFAATIIDSNVRARRALVDRRADFVFEPLMRYRVVNVFARAFRRFATPRIRRATDGDREALAQFLEKRNSAKPFGWVNPLERLTAWPDFAIDRFFVALDDAGAIRACVAVWNPSPLQRFVVLGKTLSINYLTNVETDDEATLRALVAAVRRARDLPHAHLLSYCGRGTHGIPATLYTVRHRDLPPLGESHDAGFELALA